MLISTHRVKPDPLASDRAIHSLILFAASNVILMALWAVFAIGIWGKAA